MSKILLVEDDNNLREIYEARLQAEGYDIVSARDGEEALTVAMKERPDLIISDVMMPKISGFDMLDIIRSTKETMDVKVIMMTALSQAEDKARAEKLGADRYLVKSQVTLEDVAKVAREVLQGDRQQSAETSESSSPAIAQTQPTPINNPSPPPVTDTTSQTTVAQSNPAPIPVPVPVPVTPAFNDTPADSSLPQQPAQAQSTAMSAINPVQFQSSTNDNTDLSTNGTPQTSNNDTTDNSSQNLEQITQSSDEEQAAIAAQIDSFIDGKEQQSTSPVPAPNPDEPTQAQEPTTPDAEVRSVKKKVIQPLNDPNASKGPDLDNLLQKEQEKEKMAEIAKDILEHSNQSQDQSSTAVSADSSDSSPTPLGDEESAEAILKKAAENNHIDTAAQTATPATPETTDTHVPEVAINEDGNLTLKAEPEQTTSEQALQNDAINLAETPLIDNSQASVTAEAPQPEQNQENDSSDQEPQVENKMAEELPQPTIQLAPSPVNPTAPNIPHTNGTSIDGVVNQQGPPSQALPQPNPAPQETINDTTRPDPSSIAL